MEEYTNIKQELKQMLKEKRYIHTLSTQKEAIKLANNYNIDPEKASLAALLHDCAKNFSDEKMFKILKQYSIPIDDIEKINTATLHGKVGKIIAKTKFNINDKEILSAIEYHTTGKANMSLLEKIIFLADVIEETRTYDGVDEIRKIAYKNLNDAIIISLERTISFVISKNQLLHPDTINARNYLILEKINNE